MKKQQLMENGLRLTELVYLSFRRFGEALADFVIAEDLESLQKKLKTKDDIIPGNEDFDLFLWRRNFTDENNNILNNNLHPYRPENYPYNSVAYPGTMIMIPF